MHSTNKFQMEFSFDNFVSTWAQRPRCPRASISRTMLSSKCSLLVDSSNLESARTGDCGPWWRCAVPPPARLTAARLSPTTSLTDRATIALSTLVPHGPTPHRPKDRFLTISTDLHHPDQMWSYDWRYGKSTSPPSAWENCFSIQNMTFFLLLRILLTKWLSGFSF